MNTYIKKLLVSSAFTLNLIFFVSIERVQAACGYPIPGKCDQCDSACYQWCVNSGFSYCYDSGMTSACDSSGQRCQCDDGKSPVDISDDPWIDLPMRCPEINSNIPPATNCNSAPARCCNTAQECLDEGSKPTPPPPPTPYVPPFNPCDPTGNNQECTSCFTNGGVWTGLGCIRFSPKDFVTDFLKIALGVAGGIALLLMIYGSFLISTSAGDPKKADEGKEIITGTIAGLLFIIFSVFLLKLIGVDILGIPGL